MNYQKIYDSLIARGKNRVLPPGTYTERHHIIPKCIGGSNDEANLVSLLPEEHFVAHQLLIKLHPENSKLVFAALYMTVKSPTTRRANNKLYGWLRRLHAISISKLLTGIKRKPFSEEHRTKLSNAHRGKPLSKAHRDAQSMGKKGKPLSELTKAKRPSKGNGKPASEERKRKISESQKGKKLSDDHLKNLRKAKAIPMTDDVKSKISASLKGRKLSQETLEKRRQTRLKKKELQ